MQILIFSICSKLVSIQGKKKGLFLVTTLLRDITSGHQQASRLLFGPLHEFDHPYSRTPSTWLITRVLERSCPGCAPVF